MSNYVRWYDKDPDLSHLMKFIESLNDDIRDSIAHDLIQIILSEIDTNNDVEIYQLGLTNCGNYQRWYDKHATLHSAIEIIRNLNSEKRVEIIQLIMESIVQILVDYENEK